MNLEPSQVLHQAESEKKIVKWVSRLEKLANANEGLARGEGREQAGDNVVVSEGELCFKLAQLGAELLIIMFALILLIIVAIIFASNKTPVFMKSFELVPKFLFIACVIVASYSFCCWSLRKLKLIESKSSCEKKNLKRNYGTHARRQPAYTIIDVVNMGPLSSIVDHEAVAQQHQRGPMAADKPTKPSSTNATALTTQVIDEETFIENPG